MSLGFLSFDLKASFGLMSFILLGPLVFADPLEITLVNRGTGVFEEVYVWFSESNLYYYSDFEGQLFKPGDARIIRITPPGPPFGVSVYLKSRGETAYRVENVLLQGNTIIYILSPGEEGSSSADLGIPQGIYNLSRDLQEGTFRGAIPPPFRPVSPEAPSTERFSGDFEQGQIFLLPPRGEEGTVPVGE